MTVESMLSKRPVLRFVILTVTLRFPPSAPVTSLFSIVFFVFSDTYIYPAITRKLS